MSIPVPGGINRLMDEAERTAREMVHEAADTWTERRVPIVGAPDAIERVRQHPHQPPDAGAIAMIRRNVEDAAHLQDDLLREVFAVLEQVACQYLRICDLETIEQGQACWRCSIAYRLRCAGVEPAA